MAVRSYGDSSGALLQSRYRMRCFSARMLKCKLWQFCVTIFAFFQIQCYQFCTRTPIQCYQFCSSVLPFLRLYTLYIIRNIYLYIFLLLYKIELKKMNSKRAYARSAHARGEKVFCLFAIGKRVFQFQFFVPICCYGKNCSDCVLPFLRLKY